LVNVDVIGSLVTATEGGGLLCSNIDQGGSREELILREDNIDVLENTPEPISFSYCI